MNTVVCCASTTLWYNWFQVQTTLDWEPCKTLSVMQVFYGLIENREHSTLEQEPSWRTSLLEHQKKLGWCGSRWQDQTELFGILWIANWTSWGELRNVGGTARKTSCKKQCDWNILNFLNLVYILAQIRRPNLGTIFEFEAIADNKGFTVTLWTFRQRLRERDRSSRSD